jgi:hypothetical protein
MSTERVFGTEIQVSTEDQGLEEPTDEGTPRKKGKDTRQATICL